ncbi:MAG: glutaminase A [Muribaculaceae bacterium]|jgi:glutaminase
MERTITVSDIRKAAQEAYNEAKGVKGGANADYIPYLANIDPELFGLSITLTDGTSFNFGDTEYRFGIESVSKVPTAILAMIQHTPDGVLERIGADATGLPFNSIFAILLENDHPSTPLVNAGAIAACSMIAPQGATDDKWKAITDNITALCGSAPELIDELYESETATNFNNRAISWLLKNYGRIYDDVDISLDLYTRQCSLGITSAQLAVMGATIANKGLNPVTAKQVFDPVISAKITTMMASVGFYQHTGDWLYTSGIPAKTGVGGGVMGVMPGLFGIAAFAPPLDGAGNSVKAQTTIRLLMSKLDLGIFSGDKVSVVS